MSSTERNKVKSFGDPSIDHGEMADRFLIVGAFNAPPPVTNRVNKKSVSRCDTYFLGLVQMLLLVGSRQTLHSFHAQGCPK